MLGGLYHAKVLKALLKEEKRPLERKPFRIRQPPSSKNLDSLSLTITGSKTLEQAQVTTGGIPLKELDEHTLESKKSKGFTLPGNSSTWTVPAAATTFSGPGPADHIAGVSAGKGDL
ncbi:MAG: hypothetical protein ACLR2E_04910 [Lachnospiraceae bacterium]